MHGIHKKAISGILCIALVLAFGKSTDISDIIIGRNTQQSISQKESYNLKSSSNKINLLNQSETKQVQIRQTTMMTGLMKTAS